MRLLTSALSLNPGRATRFASTAITNSMKAPPSPPRIFGVNERDAHARSNNDPRKSPLPAGTQTPQSEVARGLLEGYRSAAPLAASGQTPDAYNRVSTIAGPVNLKRAPFEHGVPLVSAVKNPGVSATPHDYESLYGLTKDYIPLISETMTAAYADSRTRVVEEAKGLVPGSPRDWQKERPLAIGPQGRAAVAVLMGALTEAEPRRDTAALAISEGAYRLAAASTEPLPFDAMRTLNPMMGRGRDSRKSAPRGKHALRGTANEGLRLNPALQTAAVGGESK